jgi:hypothetical protein
VESRTEDHADPYGRCVVSTSPRTADALRASQHAGAAFVTGGASNVLGLGNDPEGPDRHPEKRVPFWDLHPTGAKDREEHSSRFTGHRHSILFPAFVLPLGTAHLRALPKSTLELSPRPRITAGYQGRGHPVVSPQPSSTTLLFPAACVPLSLECFSKLGE